MLLELVWGRQSRIAVEKQKESAACYGVPAGQPPRIGSSFELRFMSRGTS
jgi:hypothetical protein